MPTRHADALRRGTRSATSAAKLATSRRLALHKWLIITSPSKSKRERITNDRSADRRGMKPATSALRSVTLPRSARRKIDSVNEKFRTAKQVDKFARQEEEIYGKGPRGARREHEQERKRHEHDYKRD